MTARTFDIYDLSSPMVTPYPPQTAATAASTQPTRPYLQRLAESRLFNASVILLVFAAVLYLVGTMMAGFPLGRVTGVQNMGQWLSTIAVGLLVAGSFTALLVATVKRVMQ
jgi:hypothetical protein